MSLPRLKSLAFHAGLCLLPASVAAETSSLPDAKARASTTGFMIPKAPVLRPTTIAEQTAAEVWSLRAALNVAALQCQFSPYLRAVKNYNEMLRHHATELNNSLNTLKAHFKRYDGAKGTNSFDQYTTKTYNSFSTLDAQYSFCASAGEVARDVLMLRRGDLGFHSRKYVESLRTSLQPQQQLPIYMVSSPQPIQVSMLEPPVEMKKRKR